MNGIGGRRLSLLTDTVAPCVLGKLGEKTGNVKNAGDKGNHQDENHGRDSDNEANGNEHFNAEVFTGNCVNELGFY